MPADLPIAVVTVCRDPGDAIAVTAASVAAQSAPLRWIVIDGASGDGTPGRLRALPRPPDLLRSEPDRGIADAFNKGLALAGDAAVLYLNAGDAFSGPVALATLAAGWKRDRHRWICAAITVTDPHGQALGSRGPRPGSSARSLVDRGNRIVHPAVLAEAMLLRDLGGFDLDYRLSMDYELWLRLIAAGHQPQIVDMVVADFALGGTSGEVLARWREDRRARRRHRLSAGTLSESWLAVGAWARWLARPLRDWPLAWRLNRGAGW